MPRPEVDDLDRTRATDAVEPADALLHQHRIPRQIEEDEAAAEFKVAAFAAALGADQDRRPFGLRELRHLEVALREREILVKDRHALVKLKLELRLQPIERGASRDEDERLLLPPLPARRFVHDPLEPQVASFDRRGERGLKRLLAPAPLERSLIRQANRLLDARVQLRPLAEVDRLGDAGREPADVDATRRAGAGIERRALVELTLELLPRRELIGPEKLEQPKEAVRVGLERRCAQEKHVGRGPGERRDRAIGRVARMSGTPLQSMRLIDHEQVRLRVDRGASGPRVVDQILQRHDRARVHLERIEAGTEVAPDIASPLRVEQHEDLVEFSVELAEPLNREGPRRDHQHARRSPHAKQPREDKARLDRLAEADLIREQPAHRIGRRGELRHVELMRKDPDPPAEIGAEAARFAQLHQAKRVEAITESTQRIDLCAKEPLDQIVAPLLGPAFGVGPGWQHERNEGVVVEAELQRLAELGEADGHSAVADLHDLARAEFAVKPMKQLVADGEHRGEDNAWGPRTIPRCVHDSGSSPSASSSPAPPA